MAKVVDNLVTSGLSGKVSKYHQFKQIFGDTFFTRIGVNRVAATDKQIDMRERFAEASRQARLALLDPIEYAKYELIAKRGKYKTPYGAAFSFFYNNPAPEAGTGEEGNVE